MGFVHSKQRALFAMSMVMLHSGSMDTYDRSQYQSVRGARRDWKQFVGHRGKQCVPIPMAEWKQRHLRSDDDIFEDEEG